VSYLSKAASRTLRHILKSPLDTVSLYSKHTGALTFQNYLVVSRSLFLLQYVSLPPKIGIKKGTGFPE
jgi:hypothetical protein